MYSTPKETFSRTGTLKVLLAALIVAEFPVEVYDILVCQPERKTWQATENFSHSVYRKNPTNPHRFHKWLYTGKARFLALTGPIDFLYLAAP